MRRADHRLRLHASIARDQADTSSNLLQLKQLERDELFLGGVLAAGEQHRLVGEWLVGEIAAAYGRTTPNRNRKESV